MVAYSWLTPAMRTAVTAVALEVAHEHPSEGVPESRCLTTLEGTDEKNTGLRAIIADLMLDTVDLVLQHGLKRREWKWAWTNSLRSSDTPPLRAAAPVMG